MRTILLVILVFMPPALPAAGFDRNLSEVALERLAHEITYDDSYHAIDYPGGDVPADIGVCTDVVIRAYRALGVDLQVLVHEDMSAHFDAYPSRRIWGLATTDRNIDHRRVPNLAAFFRRNGTALPVTEDAADYSEGDVVTWSLPGKLPHIGIVTHRVSPRTGRPLIVHNIGRGVELEDMLFSYEITGHYRFVPTDYGNPAGGTAEASAH